MASKEEDSFVFRVIKYGIEHQTFTLNDLMKDLKLTAGELAAVKSVMTKDGDSPNDIIMAPQHSGVGSIKGETECRLVPMAAFHYIELQELKLSKEMAANAHEAALQSNENAKTSINISRWTLGISVGISLIALIMSTYFSYKQIAKPTTINPSSIQQLRYDDSNITDMIKTNNHQLETIQQTLDSINQKSLQLNATKQKKASSKQ